MIGGLKDSQLTAKISGGSFFLYIDMVVSVPVVMLRQVPTIQKVRKTVEVHQVQFINEAHGAVGCEFFSSSGTHAACSADQLLPLSLLRLCHLTHAHCVTPLPSTIVSIKDVWRVRGHRPALPVVTPVISLRCKLCTRVVCGFYISTPA